MTRIYAEPLVRLTLIMSAIFITLMTLLFFTSRADQPPVIAADNTAATADKTDPIARFVEFATAAPGDGPPVGLGHEYTSEGIRRLAAALQALASGSGDAQTGELAHFEAQADRLELDSRSLRHADIVRAAFTDAASMLAALTSRDMSTVEQAAMAIDRDVPLLQQHARVREFFRAAAAVIREHQARSWHPPGLAVATA